LNIPSEPRNQWTISSVERTTAAKGFRVLHTHDVAATLAEKGFQHGPLRIIEICNAKNANEVLQKDITTALMLPCPITVYEKDGKTHIGTMLPTVIGDFFPGKGIEPVAAQVEKAVVAIIDESAK
jgi:uncharacterized protein (DUF302 family)